jgi:hypothetical protein
LLSTRDSDEEEEAQLLFFDAEVTEEKNSINDMLA